MQIGSTLFTMNSKTLTTQNSITDSQHRQKSTTDSFTSLTFGIGRRKPIKVGDKVRYNGTDYIYKGVEGKKHRLEIVERQGGQKGSGLNRVGTGINIDNADFANKVRKK